MKIFSTLALLSLALLSCSSALDEANNSQQEALDEAHQANLTGKEAVAMREVDCYAMDDNCGECLKLGHCKYIPLRNLCIDDKDIGQDNFKNDQLVTASDKCPRGPIKLNVRAEEDNSTSPQVPTVSTTSSPASEATTTTSATSTSSVTTTASTTPASTTPEPTTTSTPNATSTTTPVPTTTTAAPTTTAGPSTTTTAPPTSSSTPTPDSRGSKFDGWSFFGGMLLAFGLLAIAFVSFKYYKVRTGQASPNYNRF